MDNEQGTNGKPKAAYTDQLIIDFNRETFALGIGGAVANWEVAMCIVEQAKRAIDAKLKAQQIAAFQQDVMEAGRTQQILADLRNGKRQ
jgi:demethoxyubiquinone hydroxylase (CLK1/Coq7/Cat5 family)